MTGREVRVGMAPFRILIVDDDPAVVRMLQRIVEEQGLGTVVGRAGTGPEGEANALQLRPDLVLIDLLMPGQDGLETTRHLQQQGFGGMIVMISQVTDKDLWPGPTRRVWSISFINRSTTRRSCRCSAG